MKILVIDDKANTLGYHRKKLLTTLQQQSNIDYQLIEPEPSILEAELAKVESNEYDIIIVDYFFDKSRSIFKTGSSLYSLIRSYTEDTPIYLISVNAAPTNQIGDFELFVEDDFLENHSACKSDIESHSKLKSCDTLQDLLHLIQCPDEVKEDFGSIIEPKIFRNTSLPSTNEPQIPKKEIIDSLNLRLFKWIAHSLLRKEGPLVSKAGAAAMLGISQEYFDHISDHFNNALYTGVFSKSFNKRWWACLLEDSIYSIKDPEQLLKTHPFKEAAAKLLRAGNENELSKCVVCYQCYPDALGIIKDQGSELYPVHVACSEFDEGLPQEAFFKNPRVIEVVD